MVTFVSDSLRRAVRVAIQTFPSRSSIKLRTLASKLGSSLSCSAREEPARSDRTRQMPNPSVPIQRLLSRSRSIFVPG